MTQAQQRKDGQSAVAACRADFPALESAQQPSAVIDAMARYESHDHANVHRGVHTLSHRATDAYEGARETLRGFINAASTREVIFTSGTTESINLVAQSFCRPNLGAGDKILITHLEHHANIVPWQLVCEQTGAELLVAPINDKGELRLDALYALMSDEVRLLAIAHVSNALGTINPIKEIIAEAHSRDIPVLVDGAQGVPHMQVDVMDLDCDFYAFSGHKMFGPTGTGILYGKEAILDAMPPYKGGGDMILEVSFSGTTFNELPYKFEAGTPNISGAVGLGAATQYLENVGMRNVESWESELSAYMTQRLSAIEDIRLIGTATHKAGVQSFLLGDIHPHDLGTILDHQGVAIRTGHHCAMPVMEYFGVPGTARASLALYNNFDDIDRLVAALEKAKEIFA
jgi:cysteine desulfurase/selenocysteine lyase